MRSRLTARIPVVVAALAALAGLLAVAATVDRSYVAFSDGVYTYLARTVVARGPSVLYTHVTSSQPPLPVLAGAAAWFAHPGVESVRLMLALVALATGACTYLLARAVGLARPAAVVAVGIALTAPMRQFTALDGDVFLALLAPATALLLVRRRWAWAGVLVGVGLLVKLTWLLFALAAVVVALRAGLRAAGVLVSAGLATAIALCGALALVFHWSPQSLVREVLLAQRHAGTQWSLVPAIVALVVLLWWPLLVPAALALRTAPRALAWMLLAGIATIAYTVKAGTFMNAQVPAEPLLAVAAVLGLVVTWRGGSRIARGGLALCVLVASLHAATLAVPSLAAALPFPLGANRTPRDAQSRLAARRAAAAVRDFSRAGDRVFVNPYLAVLADRRLIDDEADWFILDALDRGCTHPRADAAPGECGRWAQLLRRAMAGRVVTLDRNVLHFDPALARLRAHGREVARVVHDPLRTVVVVHEPATPAAR